MNTNISKNTFALLLYWNTKVPTKWCDVKCCSYNLHDWMDCGTQNYAHVNWSGQLCILSVKYADVRIVRSSWQWTIQNGANIIYFNIIQENLKPISRCLSLKCLPLQLNYIWSCLTSTFMGHELRYKLVIWPPEPPGDPASWPQLLLEDVTSRPHLADAEGSWLNIGWSCPDPEEVVICF